MFLTDEMIVGLPVIEHLPYGFHRIPDGVFYVKNHDSIIHFKNDSYFNESGGPSWIGRHIVMWHCDNDFHRLDGPAIITRILGNSKEFWIHGNNMLEDAYWKHPLVIKHKLSQIVNL